MCPVGVLPVKLWKLLAGWARGRESRNGNQFVYNMIRKPKDCKTQLRSQMHSYYLCFHITPHFNTWEIINTLGSSSFHDQSNLCGCLGWDLWYFPKVSISHSVGLIRVLWCALLGGTLSLSLLCKCGEEELCTLFPGGPQQGLNFRVIKVPIKRRGLTWSF